MENKTCSKPPTRTQNHITPMIKKKKHVNTMFDTMRISSKMTGQNLPTSSLTSSQSLTASQNAGIMQPRLMKPGRFVYPMKTAVNSPLNHR
jgi:hypothetical protein